MKNLIISIFLVLPVIVLGQTNSENFVKSTTYQTKTTDGINTIAGDALTDDDKIETISYFDGLGRSIETISQRAGGNKEDLITPVYYDELGRSPKGYLPFVKTGNNGNYYTGSNGLNIKQEITAFYKAKFPKDFYGGVMGLYPGGWDNPYSNTLYEASPLNRTLKKGAPGTDWRLEGASINDHTIKYGYETNNTYEVRLYKVSFNGNTESPTLVDNLGYYTEHTLYKSVVKNENWQTADENNNTTHKFTNKLGQAVLLRTFTNNIAHDTYNVYDKFGNLTYVIPPLVDTSDGVNSSELNELCYQYKYDEWNRLTEKKTPGKIEEYILYDSLDRPVLTQDKNLRDDNKWMFTKYDALGRVAYTGLVANLPGKGIIQSSLKVPTYISELRTTTPTNIGGTDVYYTNFAYPTGNLEVLTINYYDSYIAYNNIVTLPTSVMGTPTTEDSQAASTTQGLPTVTKVRVLDKNEWITTLTAYDHKRRAIYIESFNDFLDTRDVIKTKLDDFTARLLESETSHSKTGFVTINTYDFYTYDHRGRPINHLQQIDNEAVQLISSNAYDELGQLLEKKVGGELWESGYTDLQNVTINPADGLITNDSTDDSTWDSGLATIGKLDSDGGLSFRIESEGEILVVGLNDVNSNNNVGDADYGFDFNTFTNNPKFFKIRIPSGTISGTTVYNEGDSFALERIGNAMYYYHNGNEIHTVALVDPNQGLIGDVAYLTSGAAIKDLDFYATSITKQLQKVDYKFNVRGWLTDINDVGDVQGFGLDLGDLFRFRINYNIVEGDTGNSGRADALYNGNIAQTIWKTSNDNVLRGYDYKYDDLNRIKEAFNRKGNSLNVTDNASVWGITYDKNGNIQQLIRNGENGNGSQAMWDNLSYTYIGGGNQLQGVVDTSTSSLAYEGFKDDTAHSNDDYLYDDNGNLTKDDNKNITEIKYNHQNLPTKITFVKNGDTSTIDYVYDATGVKLEKVFNALVGGSIPTIITQYAGNYKYQQSGTGDNELQFFSHPEGYVKPVAGSSGSVGKFSKNTGQTTNSTYSYVFQYKDHVGNVRLSYSDNNLNGAIEYLSEIVEESNYYPFGLKQKGYNNVQQGGNDLAQQWKYNGTEYNEDGELNLYEMILRQYDPAIGRWISIDPITHFSQSTYTGYDNNPVFWADPSGAATGFGGAAAGFITKGMGSSNMGNTGHDPDDDKWESKGGGKYENKGTGEVTEDWERAVGETISNSPQDTEKCCDNYKTPEGFSMPDFAFKHGPDTALAVNAASKAAANKYSQVKAATGGSGNNGVGDAVKHTFWMVQMTVLLGPKVAWEAGIANENSNESNTVFGRNMDIKNNEWGINWALNNENLLNTGSLKNINRKFYSDIFEGIKKGDLIIKSADMHYVNDQNLQNIFNALNLN